MTNPRAKPFSLGGVTFNYLEAEGFAYVAHQRLGLEIGPARMLMELIQAAPNAVANQVLDDCAKASFWRTKEGMANRLNVALHKVRTALVSVRLNSTWIRHIRGEGYAVAPEGVCPIYDFVVYGERYQPSLKRRA